MPSAAAQSTVHGVLLRVMGVGVLLTGASGVGKSELALELVTRGHQLVADDAVELRRHRGRLIAFAPRLLRGFLEARSLGILNIRRLYGPHSIAARCELELLLRLEAPQLLRDDGQERLGGRRGSVELQGFHLPEISIPIRLGHNLAVLVEAACRDLRLRQQGYRADDDLIQRQQQEILKGSRTSKQT
ncbi:HPr Serine kinase C-terminal domain-containing protein [Solimonas aquatica]|uniref:HPr Serine kinase C-terminal domain-containing protein n=1 Tax=Solimonas aquatica TaxID=489703 RepID=A0A1H9IVB1_9GAMM|nr:hypothetical protein [Solimonas aquatica]SEQ78711.1 HPr Serine kinase C-terminal domain-containing protein [Solimonas aquatica]